MHLSMPWCQSLIAKCVFCQNSVEEMLCSAMHCLTTCWDWILVTLTARYTCSQFAQCCFFIEHGNSSPPGHECWSFLLCCFVGPGPLAQSYKKRILPWKTVSWNSGSEYSSLQHAAALPITMRSSPSQQRLLGRPLGTTWFSARGNMQCRSESYVRAAACHTLDQTLSLDFFTTAALCSMLWLKGNNESNANEYSRLLYTLGFTISWLVLRPFAV